MVDLKTCSVAVILVTLYVSGQGKKITSCEVDKLKTQRNFNLSDFMGEWHVISDVEIFPHQHKLDKFVNAFTNIRVYGVQKDSHQIALTVVSRVLGVCVTTRLTVERPDFKTPSKLEVRGPDAWWGYLRETRPVWVMWTDGEGALLYSCGELAEDGTCEPFHTYSWTMNRNPEGHSSGQMFFINEKISQLCFDPADFKDMKRSWPCAQFNVEDLEADDDDDDDDDDDTKDTEDEKQEAEKEEKVNASEQETEENAADDDENAANDGEDVAVEESPEEDEEEGNAGEEQEEDGGEDEDAHEEDEAEGEDEQEGDEGEDDDKSEL